MIPRRWNWKTVVVLQECTEPPEPRLAIPQDVVSFAEGHFGLERGVITKGERGIAAITDARHMLRHYLRLHFKGMTFDEIAAVTGCATHASALLSVKKHSELMEYDKAYRRAYIGFELSAWAAGFHYRREQP